MAEPRIIEAQHPRMLPELDDENRPYWTGGADGHLLIRRCSDCARWVHPPAAACPGCGGQTVPQPVSGRGSIFSFTVNEQQFHPDVPPPYDIAIVVLDEQDDLRVITNIVGCELDELVVGMPVQVAFEQHGEVFVPLFEPVTD